MPFDYDQFAAKKPQENANGVQPVDHSSNLDNIFAEAEAELQNTNNSDTQVPKIDAPTTNDVSFRDWAKGSLKGFAGTVVDIATNAASGGAIIPTIKANREVDKMKGSEDFTPEVRKALVESFADYFSATNITDPMATKTRRKGKEIADNINIGSKVYGDKDFTDFYKSGEYGKMVGDIMREGVRSIPYTIGAAFSAPATFGIGGLSGAMDRYDEISDRTDLNQIQKVSNALAYGAIQSGSELLFDIPMVKWLKGLYSKAGKEAAEQAVKEGYQSWMNGMFKKYGLLLAPVGEGTEEVAGAFGNAVTDIITGVDPDAMQKFPENAMMGFVYGAGGGLQGSMAALPGVIANKVNNYKEKKQARANIEENLSPITNAKTGNVHAVKLRGQEKAEDEVYFVVDVDDDGFANIVDRQGNKVLDSEGKPYQNIEDFTTENVISREQILQGELQSLTQEQAAKEQAEAQTEREQNELAQIPEQLTIPNENGKEQKYVFAGEVRRNNPEKPNEITDFEVGLVDEFGEMPYDIAFLPAKTVYDYIGSQNESNEKELDQVLADAEKEVSAENSDQNWQNVTTTPSGDSNVSGKPVVTQKIGNADIDVIENEDHDEIVPSEKLPLEKALPLLEKKFKDNPKFEVVAEKERVEIPGRVIKGETKWDEDVVEPSTFKTVIKSVKIYPKEVLNQRRKEEQESKSFYQEQKKSILVDAVSKFNATPDTRSDKQKASEIEALATKLGYMTDRSPMNEIRIFNNKEGYVNIPKTSQPEQSGQINQLQTNENISNPDKLTTFKAEQQVNTSETTQPKATKPPTPKQIERAKLLKSEPNSAREVILKYFLSGGKVSPKMINRELIGRDRTGKLRSEGERRSMFWVTKGGEAEYTDQLEHILHGTPWENMLDDPTDFSNEVLDVLSLGKASNMMAELKRLQPEQGSFDQQYSPEQVSEIETWAAEQAESERLDYEEQLQTVFEELFENQNISEQEIVNLFYTNNEENDNDQNEGRSGQASPENSTTTRDNPIGSIETSRGSNEGEESQTERFGLKTTKTVQDLSDNINSILEQYSGREMAAIQAEKYLNEFPELGQQYLNGNNITSRDELKSHLAKLQSKVREGKGKERQENKKQFKEQKTQQAIDEIEQMALAADAEMQKQIEESEYNETFENKEPEKSTETKQEESVNKEDNNILEIESSPKNNTSVNQNIDFFTEIQKNIPTNDKIKLLEDKLARQNKLREQKVKNMNERNGLFGDAQADPRQIDLFTETFAPTQENFQAAIDKIDDEIAGIQRELDIERKRQITAEKENAGQLNIESEQAKNKRDQIETEKEIPSSPDGKYQIYEYKVKNNDDGVDLFYGVPSVENKGIKGFGDDLFKTIEEAVKQVEYNRTEGEKLLLEKQKEKEERELQKQQEEAAKQAKVEANKGKSKLELMNEAKNEKALNKQLNYEGNIKTRKQFIEDSVREGKTFKIGQENKIKDVTRSAYNRMNGREQEEFDKRQKEAGLKNVYKVVAPDGSYYEITKAEYDYAIKLQQQAQPVVKENLSTEPTDIFEQLQDVANKRKAEKEDKNQSVEPNEKVEVKPEVNSYGANNKIVTNERAEELKKRLRDKLNNLNVGFDPELLAIGTELAAYHIESGARKFADFSKKMIEDVGEAIKPYLKAIYNGARDIPGMEAYEPEMTEYSEVKNANVDELLKPSAENNVEKNKTKSYGKQRVLQGNNKRSPKTESPSLFQGIEGEQRTGRDSGLQSDKVLKTNGEQQQPTGREGTVLPRNADLLEPALVEFNADENDTKSFNPTQKYKDNIAAIETVISLIREKRAATPQEKETLSKYVGFGGLKDVVLNPELDKGWGVSNSKYKPLVKRVIELSNEFNEASGAHDSLGSITGSILNAHFTSSTVIHSVYDGLKKLGFKGGQILEPSAGIGNFVTFMPNHIKGNSTITAVELDDLTGNILKYLHDDVNVKVLGIQDANIPNNSQDLVISNVPFGNYKIFDKAFKGVKEQFQNRIHNYFFAKAVDMARDGGLIAFVTSKGVMDAPGNEQLRRYLDQNTEFLGAVRLPNSAFKNNANTEVVTDIIFLKKNSTINKSNPNFINVFKVSATHKDGEQQEVGVNQYFVDHPENILGDIVAGGLYSRDDYTVENKKEYDLSSAITKALPNNVYTPTTSGIGLQVNDSQETIDAIKEGNIQLTNGRLVRKQEGQLVDISINEPTAKIDHYITLRNSLMNLIYSEYLGKSDKEVNELRYYLNRQYDTFVKKYGNLDKSAIKIAKQDADGYNVLSLEVKSKQDGKADIFRQRTIQPIQNKLTAENIDEAIVISLYEHAKVDIERIAELMNLTIPEAIEKAKGKIFEEPTGGFITRDEYLSGNVKQKLKQAQQAVENGNTEFQNNVDELQNVIPRDIPAMNIEARLGSRWIPQQVYTDFAQYLFNTPQARIIYQKSIDAYSHDGRVGTVEATNKYGTSRRNGLDILVDALLINPPKIYDTIREFGQEKRVLNTEETAKAIEKYEEIRNKFEDWVYKSEDRRTLLSGIYNERFNTSVKRSYNGDHLNISGINGVELRKHQKDAIWMLLQNNGGIIDHLVGAGKTYVMVAGTMEMKRTGVAKKPMIMALKSTIPQIVESYRNAFPMAKILAPLEKDFTKENRNKLFAQIANNEWDVIIMSHENYGKIPHEADIQQKFIEDEMAEVEEERAELAAAGEKQALKGLEIRLKNLEARLEKIANIDKDNSLTFEQMGIDHIMVDESQQFKNLSYVTKQRGVAGLSKAEGSKRAFNLFIGIRYLQQKYGADKGTTFLSGTPISNSMVEMYLLLKYLRPGKMNELAFNSFDAWATTFASPSSDIEFTVTGDFKAKTRFREFINVPELSMLYTEIADIRTDENTPLDKPKMKGGGYSVEEIKMSEDQIEYGKKLMEFARTKDGSHIGMTLSKNQETAAMLLATNLSSKMAIDMRMIDSGSSYDPNGKIAKLTDNVSRIYNETDKYKGTQLIFSDLGTPKNKTNKAALLRDYMEDEMGVNLDTLNEIFGDTNEQTHRYPSVTVIKNRLSEVLEMTEAEIETIIEEANHSEASFNVYAEVKQRLIEKGIPAEQIVFIHDYNSQKSKEALFKEVQQGNIRIVLGSTQKLGTGVNVQDRVVAVHHLDVPWTPASMEQRNGRALRQGNEVAKEHLNNELPVYAYATERTLDAYKYQLLQTKQRFLDQVKSGEVEDRVIRESDGDSESGVGYAELVAMLSGNTDILTKSKLETKVNDLKRKKRNFLSEVYEAKAKIDELETRNPQIEKRIKLTGQNINELTNAIQYDENGKMAVNDIDGKKLTTVKDEKGKNKPAERTDYAKEAIKIVEEKLNRAKTGEEVDLFTINGIKISGRSNERSLIGTMSSSLFVNASNGEKYSANFSLIPGAFLNNIQKAIENIPNIQRTQEAIVEKNKRDLKAYHELLEKGTEWEKEAELTQAIEELKVVTKRLTPVEEAKPEQTSEEKQKSDNTIRIGDLSFNLGKEGFSSIAEAYNSKTGNTEAVVRINEQLRNEDYAKEVKPLIDLFNGEWNKSNKVILFGNLKDAANFKDTIDRVFGKVDQSIEEEYSPETEIKKETPIAPQVQKEPTEAKLLPVEEFRHTKTGQILYNVKINGRSDEYSNMVSVAKRYNPYGKQKPYNTFSKGFLFEKKEDAENFKNEVNNTIFDSNSTVNEPQGNYKNQESESLQDKTLEDNGNGPSTDNVQRQGNTPEYSNNGGYKGVKGQVYQELKNLILTHKVKIFDSATFETLFNKLNTKKVTHLTSSPYNTFGNPFNIAYQIYNQLEDYNGENFNDPKELGFDEEDSTPLFRKVSQIGFYSTVENSLEQIKQEKGSVEQFKAMLLKNGAKQAELDWMGWDDHFEDKLAKVTKADIQNWIDQNKIEVEEVVKGGDVSESEIESLLNDESGEGMTRQEAIEYLQNEEGNKQPKFSQYVEPGGENYKELLLTMPNAPKKTMGELEYMKSLNIGIDKVSDFRSLPDEKQNELMSDYRDYTQGIEEAKRNAFQSSHFDEPNILAHVRFNEREVNGERVLFLEEIQSDFSQAVRKGTTTAKTPFEKTDQWVNLSLRRMMRYAAENGFDRIAWTNGEMQAARYDLSKQVDDIWTSEYNDSWNGKQYEKLKDVEVTLKGDDVKKLTINESGIVVHGDFIGESLDNIVGKEMAEKIINAKEDTNFGEQDLKIGGSGMKAFYDAIVPSAASKLGKPFGAKVENIQIDVKPEMTDEGIDLESGEVGTAPEGKYAEVQSIPVTDKMIESVSQGVPLFRNEYDTPIEAAERIVKAMNQRAEMVKGIADRFSNELNTPIIVVRNETMLPLNLQRQVKKQGAKRSVMGVFNPTDGKIYLVSNNIPSELEAEKTVLHEIVGHKGLRRLLGAKEHRKLMGLVWDSLTPAQKADLKNRLGNLDPLVLADEYMAEMAEQNRTPKWYDKVLAKLREMLRKVFPNLRINNTELKTIIRKSYEALKRPTPEQFDNPLDFAEALSRFVKTKKELTSASFDNIDEDESPSRKSKNTLSNTLESKNVSSNTIESNSRMNRSDANIVNKVTPKYPEVNYELTKEENWKFAMDLQTAISGKISHSDYQIVNGNTLLRIKDHTPNWVNFEDDIENNPNIKRIVNVTVGDYNNSDYRRNKWSIDEFEERYPDIEFMDFDIEDGESLFKSIDLISMLLNKPLSEDKSPAALFRIASQARSEDISHLDNAAANIERKPSKVEVGKIWEETRKAIQDRDLPVRRLIENIVKRGGRLNNDANAYRDISLAHGRAENLLKNFEKDLMQSVIDAVSAFKQNKGITQEKITLYTIAKHAPERNAQIRKQRFEEWLKQNPQPEDPTKYTEWETEVNQYQEYLNTQDFSGILSQDVDEEYKGNPEGYANQLVKDFEAIVERKQVNDYWKAVRGVNKFTLGRWLEGNQIDPDYYEQMVNGYKYYVPLKGWWDDAAKELDYHSGKGTGKSLHKAEGRKSLPDDPLAYMEHQAFKSISEQVDNEVKLSMLRFVMDNMKGNEDIINMKRVYYVQNPLTGEWDYTLEKPTPEQFADGSATMVQYRDHFKLRKPVNAQEHEVWVDTKYGTFAMVFPDKGLEVAQALNHQNNLVGGMDAEMFNKFLGGSLGKITNIQKALYTSWNVTFPVKNILRDMPEAASHLLVKYGPKQAADFSKELPLSMGTAKRYLYGKFSPKRDNKGNALNNDAHFEDFASIGGMTGFTHLKTPEEYQKELSDRVRKAAKKGVNLKEQLEKFSELFEDTTRFAAYKSGILNGMSKRDAAMLAKEVSVNFNRKGKLSKSFDAIFAFFNAALQAGQKNLKLAKDNPKAFMAVAAGWVVLGGLIAEMNRMFDDDEEYERLNSFVRMNYLVFPIGNGEYFRMPLPQFFRGFYGMGANISDLAHGKTDFFKAMGNGILNFANALTPIELSAFFDADSPWYSSFVPTVFKPMSEIAENKDFMNYPIYKEAFTKDLEGKLANSGMHKNNVNTAYKFVTDALFRAGHGDSKYKSYFDKKTGTLKEVNSALDWNPSKIEYFIKAYTGGTGAFINDFANTLMQVSTTGTVEQNNIPFINSFVRNYPEKTIKVIGEYYDMKKDVDKFKSIFNEYKKDPSKSETIDDMLNNKKYWEQASKVKKIDKQFDYLKNQFENGNMTIDEYIAKRANIIIESELKTK